MKIKLKFNRTNWKLIWRRFAKTPVSSTAGSGEKQGCLLCHCKLKTTTLITWWGDFVVIDIGERLMLSVQQWTIGRQPVRTVYSVHYQLLVDNRPFTSHQGIINTQYYNYKAKMEQFSTYTVELCITDRAGVQSRPQSVQAHTHKLCPRHPC